LEQPKELVVVPRGLTTRLLPLHESKAVGVSKVQAFVQVTVLAAGQLKAGGWSKSTVTDWLQVELTPLQALVAVQD
jgi:hypothetical protein